MRQQRQTGPGLAAPCITRPTLHDTWAQSRWSAAPRQGMNHIEAVEGKLSQRLNAGMPGLRVAD